MKRSLKISDRFPCFGALSGILLEHWIAALAAQRARCGILESLVKRWRRENSFSIY